MADFVLVSRRVLDENEYRIFRFHYLLAADWKLCCRRLNMERGDFFHEVYRIQQKLGRAFRELQPYALFPLDEYFGGTTRSNTSIVEEFPVETPKPEEPVAQTLIKFPVKRAA